MAGSASMTNPLGLYISGYNTIPQDDCDDLNEYKNGVVGERTFTMQSSTSDHYSEMKTKGNERKNNHDGGRTSIVNTPRVQNKSQTHIGDHPKHSSDDVTNSIQNHITLSLFTMVGYRYDLVKYTFNAMNNHMREALSDHRQIIEEFIQVEANDIYSFDSGFDFKTALLGYCREQCYDDSDDLDLLDKSAIHLYETMKRYQLYSSLLKRINTADATDPSQCCCSSCRRKCPCCQCYIDSFRELQVQQRTVSGNTITLTCVPSSKSFQNENEDKNLYEPMVLAMEEPTEPSQEPNDILISLTKHDQDKTQALSMNFISLTKRNQLEAQPSQNQTKMTSDRHEVRFTNAPENVIDSNPMHSVLEKHDELIAVNDMDICADNAFDLLKSVPLYTFDLLKSVPLYTDASDDQPHLTLTFQRHQAKWKGCCACNCCKKCKKDKDKNNNSRGGCVDYLLKWLIKFLQLSQGIMAKMAAVFDMYTDCRLFYKAAMSGTTWLMMALFLSMLAPYVLSYSSGIQIFNHRGTFENVKLWTFKSLLLAIYIFPSGVLYWIILDAVDALLEIYKWFAFGVCGKIKTQTELVLLESNTANYFGLSRMDWLSFKRQKVIAQLYFETIPQLTLQFILLWTGAASSTITHFDLSLSVASALLNSGIGTYRITLESKAVNERFLQYALHCITSRFGWVPFQHIIDEFKDCKTSEIDEFKDYIDHYRTNNPPSKCCDGCLCAQPTVTAAQTTNDLLELDYTLSFSLPVITYLSEKRANEENKKACKIGCKLKVCDTTMGSVPFDFSETTIQYLISSIQYMERQEVETKRRTIRIIWGESLRLLNVRDIVCLMQACRDKHIELPDIHKIDWKQAFSNSFDTDPRLLSHTFDAEDRSLLISLYLAGYHGTNRDYPILRAFVSEFDVPINTRDAKGDTIMHHMIRGGDYYGIRAFLDSLQPKQRFNFDAQNDDNHVVMHELIRRFKMDGLRMLFVAMKPTQFINFNLQDYTENTILHILAKEYDTSHQAVVAVVDNLKAKQYINFGTQNSHKNTVMHELLSHGKFNIKDLKDVLKIMKKQSIQDVNISAFNENGRAVIYLALEKDRHTLKKMQQSLPEQSSIADRLDIYIHDMMDIIPPFDTDVRWVELSSYTIASIANVFAFKHNWEGTLSEKVDGLNKQTKHGKKHTFHVVVNSETIQSDTMMHRLITEQFPTVVNAKICTKQVSTDELISNTAFGYILQHFEDYPHYFDDLIQFYLAYGDQGYPLLFSSEPSTLIYSLFKSALPATHCFRTFDEIIRRFKVSMTAICDAQNGSNPIHHCLKQIQLNSKKQTQLVIQSVDVLGRAMVRKSEHCARTLLLPFLCDEEYDTESINYDFGMGKSSRIMRQCPDVIYLDQKQHRQGIKKLNILCERYPEWLLMEDKNGDIPLSVALHTKDIDSFFCIYRFMLERKVDMNVYFNDRAFIQQMIAFASSFVLNPGTNWIVKLLLSTLNYDEVFKWSADPNHFNPYLDSDISLVKSLSQIKEFKLSDTQEHLFSQFLSEKCENGGVIYKQENASNRDSKNAHIHHVYPTQGVDLPNYDTEGEYETKLSFEYEDQRVNVMDLLEKPHASKAPSSSSSDHEEQASMTNWIELLYSTIVESCSALDLYSDVIILIALYKSHNHWWSTNMLMLLCAPYLVSYGSLVVLLRKKIEHKELSGCNIFFGYLLITPLSLVYLFCIDVLFMLFTLGSTLWFLLALTFLSIKNGCKVPSNLAEHDGRDWFERKVFIQWLQMNYTEMVSYRRLRTLSQLFFETIPQIVLQVWIISDIKWLGNENEFDLDDFEWKLTLSIGVAIAHLILEGGIMLLDRSAFEMGFMQYAMVSLGGRTLWVPFQHFIHKIVKYQIYIHRDGDCDECDRFDTDYFDAEEYNICEVNRSTNCTIGTNVLKLLYRDYADISTEVCGCVPYKIDYQFSVQDVQTLTQKLANAPLMLVPHAFELSTTNAVLQNLMRHLLCRAEIKLGSVSCENMDIFSLCKLYKVSLKKMKLNIDSIEIQTVDTMIDTSKIKHTNKGIDDINQIIESSLIAYGEASAIRWINTYRNLSYKQQTSIKNIILKQCVSQNGALRSLNCLQRSYKSNFYPGKHCEAMNRINEMIVQCHLRSKQHESWCFVIIFLLLYTRGSIFDMSCSNGCCSFLPLVVETREELSHYVPSHIKVDSSMIKIPFQMFEQCLWSRDYIESILVDRCKKYILDPRILQTKQIIKDFTVPKQAIATIAHEYKTLIDYVAKETQDRWPQHPLQQLHEIEVDVENVAYWDALFVALQLNINYQDYLSMSLKYRHLLQHEYHIDVSNMQPPTINKQILYFHHRVAPQQLLPQYKPHEDSKYQISQLQVRFHFQLQDLKVTDEEFYTYAMDACTEDEKEALETMLNSDLKLVKLVKLFGESEDARRELMKKARRELMKLFDESKDVFLAKLKTRLQIPHKRSVEICNAIINAATTDKFGHQLQCCVYLNDSGTDAVITDYSTIYLWDWHKNQQDVDQYALDYYNQKLISSNENLEIIVVTNIPTGYSYNITMNVEYIKLYCKEEQSNLTDKSAKPLHRFSVNDVISVIEHWVLNDVVYQKNKKAMIQLVEQYCDIDQSVAVEDEDGLQFGRRVSMPNIIPSLDVLMNAIQDQFAERRVKNTVGSLTAKYVACLKASFQQEMLSNMSKQDLQDLANWICNLSLNQLITKIRDADDKIDGKRFLQLYNPGPKGDRTWIQEVTGWNSNEIHQIECILLKNQTPQKDDILKSIEYSLKESQYKINRDVISKLIDIFVEMDVEELYLKIRNAFDIQNERRHIYDKIVDKSNKIDVNLNVLYACIATAFCTSQYQVERVSQLESKRLSSLAVSWTCGNCGCANYGYYVRNRLQFEIHHCVVCGISEERSIIMQLKLSGIYVKQKYTRHRDKDEDQKDADALLNETPFNIDCPLSLIDLTLDDCACTSILRLGSVLKSYQEHNSMEHDNSIASINMESFSNELFGSIIVDEASNMKGYQQSGRLEDLQNLLLNHLTDIKNAFATSRKAWLQFINMHRKTNKKLKLSLKTGPWMALHKKVKKRILQEAKQTQFEYFLKNVDIQQAENDFHHVLQYHVKGDNATKQTKKSVNKYFSFVVKCDDHCTSGPTRIGDTETRFGDRESRDSKKVEEEMSAHGDMSYTKVQLDLIHAFLIHKLAVEIDEEEAKTKPVAQGRSFSPNKHKSNQLISYGFGIYFDYPTIDPITCKSIQDESERKKSVKFSNLFSNKCMKDEILKCNLAISKKQIFHNLIVKSIMKCTAFTEKSSELKCATYDRNYNIIRNKPIGIRHMIALTIYCDYSEFCTFFRQIYWKKENSLMHADLYHYARSLFESVHCFGTEMNHNMRVYHGVNTKMSFDRFTAQFFQPISTTLDANVAQTFSQGVGMVLVLKRSRDKHNVTRYIDMLPISMYPNESEFLFHNATFTIDDILTVRDRHAIEGRKLDILMFNLLQKAIKDEPTEREWKRKIAIRGIGVLSKLIDEIAILQRAEESSDSYFDEVVRHLSHSMVSNRAAVTKFVDFCTLEEYDSEAMKEDIDIGQASQSNIKVLFGDNKAANAIVEYLELTDENADHATRILLRTFCQARESTIYIQSESELPSAIRAALLHDKRTNQLSFIRFSNVFPNATDIILKDLSLDHVRDNVDEYCTALQQYIERKIDKKLMTIALELCDSKEAEFELLNTKERYTDAFRKYGIKSWDVVIDVRNMKRLVLKRKERNQFMQRVASGYKF
eukprot:905611_1